LHSVIIGTYRDAMFFRDFDKPPFRYSYVTNFGIVAKLGLSQAK